VTTILSFTYINNNVRCSETTLKLLEESKSRKFSNTDILPTRLCTHKDDVDIINKRELESLNTSEKLTYNSIDSGEHIKLKSVLDSLCPVKGQLVLTKGAQVMLTKNLSVSNKLCNGSRGCVVGFSESNLPIVKFLDGQELVIKYETWSYSLNERLLTRKQLPLQLAWAISIHKSQGMTLDCVEISLARVFECGQAYVALSRAKSLENLRVIDFNKSTIKANEIVIRFYEKLDRRF
jgi:ATP-dependent DNA helicase PIF1